MREKEHKPVTTPMPAALWQLLLRWRWWLGGASGLSIALGQFSEAFLRQEFNANPSVLFDVVLWGGVGGLAVWWSLTFAGRQERRHQAEIEQILEQQRELNQQLQRSNAQLALLSEVNRSLAASISLDEILAVALLFPQRLVPSKAAALWLHDATEVILARTTGVATEELRTLRAPFADRFNDQKVSQIVTAPADPDGLAGVCLRLSIDDGAVSVGWIELYTTGKIALQDDDWSLLHTIAGEIGEVISGARRRVREERATYALEQAIAEERARIARDIHDGLAQTLAFRRMRIDLWLDWLDQEPERLRTELIAFKPLLREQIAELRRAIFALRPIQFDELGFVGGLHRYIIEFGQQQGWTMNVDLNGIAACLSPQIEAISFRVVQEGLTNAAKHATASAVTVQSTQVDGGLQLFIRDNGRGFDLGAVDNASNHLGLRQMRERLATFQGRLTVLTQPGAGTELRIWLPIDVKPAKRQMPKERS